MAQKSTITVLTALALAAGGIGGFATNVLEDNSDNSLFLQGDVVTDASLNSAPSLVYGSGSYLTYQQQKLSASGTKFMTAEILVASNFGSGSMLHELAVECGNTPVAMSGNIAIREYIDQGINDGVILKRNLLVGTDGVARMNTGTVLSTKVAASRYVSVTMTGGITALQSGGLQSGDCALKVWSHEKYGR